MRSCNNCTKCCEGWLTTEIKGIKIYPGKPCPLVDISIGCKDYENRPESPCKAFKCEWLVNDQIPEDFSPIKIDTIFLAHYIDGIGYLQAAEAGKSISTEVVSWLFLYHKNTGFNIAWDIGEKRYWVGTNEFTSSMNKAYG
jgi:hypothetical protein